MTVEQIASGMAYAEDNFLNEQASHLKVDKKLVRDWVDFPVKKILDFGCGMGGMTLWYAKNFNADVTGIDIDAHHIEIAQRLKHKYEDIKVDFKVRDVLTDPMEETFDVIFLNDVVEHIPIDILGKILALLKMNLTPGGKLFIAYPPWDSPYASHLNHVIKIPWVQFLPDAYVNKLIDKNNHTLIGNIESDLKSAYHGLNKLRPPVLKKLLDNAGLKIHKQKTHCVLNKIPGLGKTSFYFYPLKYLVTKVFILVGHEA